jgi:hypothetical protein
LSLVDAANICTIVLAAAAIVAGFLAWRNLGFLREQHRRNTFLSLMNEISNERARENREIIHECVKPNAEGQYPREIPELMVFNVVSWGRQVGAKDVKDAIEETVSCLDKIGFFLLRGDPKLKNEAPVSIWMITSEMWEKLGGYVKEAQNKQGGYGKYFEELANEAKQYGELKRGEASLI